MTNGDPESPAATRPNALLVVRDAALREEVHRVAAAADCAFVEVEPPIPRAAWTRAHALVLDAEAARSAAADRLPRRAGTAVVTHGTAGLDEWRGAAMIGGSPVIALPEGESELVHLLSARHDPVSGGGAVIAVVGARGGAGASTLAAAVALVGRERSVRERVLLVDGDAFGGGLDLLLGIEDTAGLRWPSLVLEGGRIAAGALHAALPSVRPGVAVLACGRGGAVHEPTPAAVRAVLESASGRGDLVVGDVPRRSGDIADAFLATADLAVLLVPAELRASAAAESIARYVTDRCGNVGLVVRGPAPGGLRGNDIAEAVGVPLLAATRPEPGLADRLERGGLRLRRRSPLRVAAHAVLDTVTGSVRSNGRAA